MTYGDTVVYSLTRQSAFHCPTSLLKTKYSTKRSDTELDVFRPTNKHFTTMTYSLLLTGYRPTITHLTFDPHRAILHPTTESKSPENASWLEPSLAKPDVLYTLSEVPEGKVYSLRLKEGEVEITGEAETKGEEPAHSALRCVWASYLTSLAGLLPGFLRPSQGHISNMDAVSSSGRRR